jgi:hypothetical protein
MPFIQELVGCHYRREYNQHAARSPPLRPTSRRRRASSDCETVLALDAIPPEARAYPIYFDLWESLFLGLLDFTRSEEELDFEVAPDRSRVCATFRWADE